MSQELSGMWEQQRSRKSCDFQIVTKWLPSVPQPHFKSLKLDLGRGYKRLFVKGLPGQSELAKLWKGVLLLRAFLPAIFLVLENL